MRATAFRSGLLLAVVLTIAVAAAGEEYAELKKFLREKILREQREQAQGQGQASPPPQPPQYSQQPPPMTPEQYAAYYAQAHGQQQQQQQQQQKTPEQVYQEELAAYNAYQQQQQQQQQRQQQQQQQQQQQAPPAGTQGTEGSEGPDATKALRDQLEVLAQKQRQQEDAKAAASAATAESTASAPAEPPAAAAAPPVPNSPDPNSVKDAAYVEQYNAYLASFSQATGVDTSVQVLPKPHVAPPAPDADSLHDEAYVAGYNQYLNTWAQHTGQDATPYLATVVPKPVPPPAEPEPPAEAPAKPTMPEPSPPDMNSVHDATYVERYNAYLDAHGQPYGQDMAAYKIQPLTLPKLVDSENHAYVDLSSLPPPPSLAEMASGGHRIPDLIEPSQLPPPPPGFAPPAPAPAPPADEGVAALGDRDQRLAKLQELLGSIAADPNAAAAQPALSMDNLRATINAESARIDAVAAAIKAGGGEDAVVADVPDSDAAGMHSTEQPPAEGAGVDDAQLKAVEEQILRTMNLAKKHPARTATGKPVKPSPPPPATPPPPAAPAAVLPKIQLPHEGSLATDVNYRLKYGDYLNDFEVMRSGAEQALVDKGEDNDASAQWREVVAARESVQAASAMLVKAGGKGVAIGGGKSWDWIDYASLALLPVVLTIWALHYFRVQRPSLGDDEVSPGRRSAVIPRQRRNQGKK